MSLNSKAFLVYQENIATGIEPAQGTIQRKQERSTLADKWAWIESLDAEQRARLRYEFENQKNHNHDNDND